MLPFSFATTAQILCETGASRRLAELCRERGAQRVLIVTDPGISKLGLLDEVLPGFARAELTVEVFDQVVADPHTIHREMVVDIGDYRGTGSPIKLSRTPASYRRAPPGFAEHTAEVLEERSIDADRYREALPGLDPGTAAKRGSRSTFD